MNKNNIITNLSEIKSLDESQLNNLLYIVGSARGGTTVLQRAIGLHDQILMLPRTSHFVDNVWPYRRILHSRLLRIIHRLPNYYRDKEVIESMGESGKKLRRYINHAFKKRNPKILWQLYPLIYSLDENNNKDINKIRFWGDKATGPRKVQSISKMFPSARFVYIVRDPRGVVASQTQRTLKMSAANDESEKTRLTIKHIVGWLRLAVAIRRHAIRDPERVYVVRMEDFLDNPVEVLNNIYEFVIGNRMEEAEIARRLKGIVYTETMDSNAALENYGISKKPIDRWKSILTEEQIDMIGYMVSDIAKAFGYDIEGKTDLIRASKTIKNSGTLKETGLTLSKYLLLRTLATKIS